MIRLDVAPAVADAIAAGRAVVALESSLIAHGLPPPYNVEAATEAERAVREEGAVPATVAVADGRAFVGAGNELIRRLASEPGVLKVAASGIGPALAGGALGGATVSATLRLASLAGIRVFATGGIGGVHPGASTTFDVSADLDGLAATPMAVVCSGAKSLLDLPATLQALETRGVPVVGLGTGELPAFYSRSSGLLLTHRVDDPADAAALAAIHLAIPRSGAILFVQPPPADLDLDPDELAGLIAAATDEAARSDVTGGRLTPWILGRLGELAGGRTVRTNVGLIVGNARAAARIAVELASRDEQSLTIIEPPSGE